MKLLLSSHNLHKVKEITELLDDQDMTVVTPNDLGLTFDVEENGNSFLENAHLKARAFAEKFNLPALSDDSGICVDALNGLPGIYSKRYSGSGDDENNAKLLEALRLENNRSAHYVCALVLAFPDGKTFSFEAHFNGKIAKEVKGQSGFGYDPIFIPDGEIKTIGELGENYKRIHSHRAKALQKLKEAKHEIIDYWRFTWQK